MSQLNKCLVLNADYAPLSICSLARAMKKIGENESNPNKGYMVVEYNEGRCLVDSQGRQHQRPCVVRTIRYINKVHKKGIPYNTRNVFIRDNYTCQYCGRVFGPSGLTKDHVIPRCKWDNAKHGTPSKWTNIVAACFSCNNKKSDKTPEEVGLKLRRQPFKPGKDFKIVEGFNPYIPYPAQWTKYLASVLKNNPKEV